MKNVIVKKERTSISIREYENYNPASGCQEYYANKYVERKPEIISPDYQLGWAAHTILFDLYSTIAYGQTLKKDEIKAIVLEGCERLLDKELHKKFDKAVETVQQNVNFGLSKVNPAAYKAIYPNKEFIVTLDDKGRTLKDSIDLLLEHHDGTIEVVDFRSGGTSAEGDIKLLSYAMPFILAGENVKATVFFLANKKVSSIDVSANDAFALRKNYSETLAEINLKIANGGTHFKPIAGKLCGNCSYKSACSLRTSPSIGSIPLLVSQMSPEQIKEIPRQAIIAKEWSDELMTATKLIESELGTVSVNDQKFFGTYQSESTDYDPVAFFKACVASGMDLWEAISKYASIKKTEANALAKKTPGVLAIRSTKASEKREWRSYPPVQQEPEPVIIKTVEVKEVKETKVAECA